MDNFETELILHEPADTSDTQVFLNGLAAASQVNKLKTNTKTCSRSSQTP
jgi:hypothetical protein